MLCPLTLGDKRKQQISERTGYWRGRDRSCQCIVELGVVLAFALLALLVLVLVVVRGQQSVKSLDKVPKFYVVLGFILTEKRHHIIV